MENELFKATTVGNDYIETVNKNKCLLSIDGYLDYILVMTELKNSCPDNPLWKEKFDREIQATKRIIKTII